MKKFVCAITLSLSMATGGQLAANEASPTVSAGYSVEPLSGPIFPHGQLEVSLAQLNNWLNANYQSLNTESAKGPRENVFYLIDSRVKHIHAETGSLLPAEPDLVLYSLFAWAEPLGVIGGNMVFNALKPDSAANQEPQMPLPSSLTLDLQDDTFTLASRQPNWSVRFPYYFMIGTLNEFMSAYNQQTQLAMISTGTGRHLQSEGISQATLMLIHSSGGDHQAFVDYWMDAIGLSSQDQQRQAAGFGTRHTFDPDTLLHKELAAFETASGSFAVFYSGIDGTYQTNRPHFEDFIRAIETNGDNN